MWEYPYSPDLFVDPSFQGYSLLLPGSLAELTRLFSVLGSAGSGLTANREQSLRTGVGGFPQPISETYPRKFPQSDVVCARF